MTCINPPTCSCLYLPVASLNLLSFWIFSSSPSERLAHCAGSHFSFLSSPAWRPGELDLFRISLSIVFLLFLLGGRASVLEAFPEPPPSRWQHTAVLPHILLIESVKWPYLEIMTYHLPLTEWAQSLPEWESAPEFVSSSPAMSDAPVSTLTLQCLASSLFLESHSLIFVQSSHICGTHLQAVAFQIMCSVCLLHLLGCSCHLHTHLPIAAGSDIHQYSPCFFIPSRNSVIQM